MSANEPPRDESQSSILPGSWEQEVVYAVLAFLGFAALGLLLVAVQALNPLFGAAIGDPDSLVFILVGGGLGAAGVVFRPKPRSAEPAVSLHDEVRRLADAGERDRAIRLHADLTGQDQTWAQQAIDAYLASRKQNPA